MQANIITRNEQRDRAVRNLLRFGAILGKRIDDVLRIVEGRRTAAAALQKSGAAAGTIAAVERQIATDEAALAETLGAYRDTVAEVAQDYPAEVVDRQLPVLRDELKARHLAQLVPFADRFRNHLSDFQKTGRLDEEGLLKSFR